MPHNFPLWLTVISWIWIGFAIVSFVIIIIDEFLLPQHMWIMNVVWAVTALYSGIIGLYAYFTVGRLSTHKAHKEAMQHKKIAPNKTKPFWQIVGVGATHCGSGCALGDLCAEWLTFIVPLVIGKAIFGTWIIDYLFAFSFGILFQYFTIKPMKNLSVGKGLVAALKADTLSLTAWQIGMYGWMAVVTFVIFQFELPKTSPVFWFMMQIAMFLGFATSYPVNWWLLKKGVKEPM